MGDALGAFAKYDKGRCAIMLRGVGALLPRAAMATFYRRIYPGPREDWADSRRQSQSPSNSIRLIRRK